MKKLIYNDRIKSFYRMRLIMIILSLAILHNIAYSQVGSNTSALLGDTSYSNDCSPEHQAFNDKMMMFGRIAAASEAFEECVKEKVRTLYKKCNNDPFFNASLDIQIQKVIDISRSVNNVHVKCTGGDGGNATAGIDHYGKLTDETFSWGEWFSDVYNQLDKRVCNLNSGEQPRTHNCRYAEYPWPYSQGAGIIWHEVMHQQGYTHGANDQENAKRECGYEDDDSWHFRVNTMPYIIGNCIDEILTQSGRLGSIDNCNSSNQLRIVTQYNGRSLKCINDPGKKGLGIIEMKNNKLTDHAIKPNGDWIGNWHLGAENQIIAKGDFNGDDLDDFVIKSDWGIGILTYKEDIWEPLAIKPNGTRFGAWNYQSRDNKVKGVGDFNGDGKDDIILTSNWGIGILTLRGNSLTSLVTKRNGTRFGGWNFQSRDNNINFIGDFNGDRKDDIVITSKWGIGILTLQQNNLSALLVKPNGTRFGGWNYQSTDNNIKGVGDFNRDGKEDIVITSDWGIGIFTLQSSGLQTLMIKPNGTRFGGWNFQSKDNTISKIGDFNGNGKDDLIITSNWGIAILEFNSGTLSPVLMKPNGTRFGGWNYRSTDSQIRGVGDFNGDGKDDIVLTSRWGLGILSKSGGSLASLDLRPNGKLLGSWLLEKTDHIAFVGDFANRSKSKLLIHKKN